MKNSKKKNKTKKRLKKKKLEKKSNGTDFEEKENKSKSTGKPSRETRDDSIRKGDKERAHGRLAETPMPRTCGRETPMPRTCGREIKAEKDEEDEKDVNGDMTPSSRCQAPQANTPKIWPAQVHVVPDRFMRPRRQVVMSRSTPITQRERNKGMQSNFPAIPQSWRSLPNFAL